MNQTIITLSEQSWDVSEGSQYKGYNMIMLVNGEEMFNLTKGENKGNYKESSQDFLRDGNDFELFFKVYEN